MFSSHQRVCQNMLHPIEIDSKQAAWRWQALTVQGQPPAFMALHSMQARLDGMASQVAWLGECIAAPDGSPVPEPWGIAHPLRMKSTHVISIRLSFSMHHPPSDRIDDQKLWIPLIPNVVRLPLEHLPWSVAGQSRWPLM